LGGARNAAGSQTVFSRNKASAALLIADPISGSGLAWVHSRTAEALMSALRLPESLRSQWSPQPFACCRSGWIEEQRYLSQRWIPLGSDQRRSGLRRVRA